MNSRSSTASPQIFHAFRSINDQELSEIKNFNAHESTFPSTPVDENLMSVRSLWVEFLLEKFIKIEKRNEISVRNVANTSIWKIRFQNEERSFSK